MLDWYYLDFFYICLGIFILIYLAVFEYCNYVTGKSTTSRQAQTVGSYGYGKCDGRFTFFSNDISVGINKISFQRKGQYLKILQENQMHIENFIQFCLKYYSH